MRRSLGCLDEQYVLELSCVKASLLKEINRRKRKMPTIGDFCKMLGCLEF